MMAILWIFLLLLSLTNGQLVDDEEDCVCPCLCEPEAASTFPPEMTSAVPTLITPSPGVLVPVLVLTATEGKHAIHLYVTGKGSNHRN